MSYKYAIITNTGKDFFTHQDRLDFSIEGYIGDVWVVGDNEKGVAWIANKNGVEKTKTEAQAIVDAKLSTSQTQWDALSEADKFNDSRPTDITLP